MCITFIESTWLCTLNLAIIYDRVTIEVSESVLSKMLINDNTSQALETQVNGNNRNHEKKTTYERRMRDNMYTMLYTYQHVFTTNAQTRRKIHWTLYVFVSWHLSSARIVIIETIISFHFLTQCITCLLYTSRCV